MSNQFFNFSVSLGGLIAKHKETKAHKDSAILGKRQSLAAERESMSSASKDGHEEDQLVPVKKPPKKKAKLEKVPRVKPTSFKDEEFFMDLTRSELEMARERGFSVNDSFAQSSKDAQMDILPDEGGNLHKSRQQSMKWDRKKKKMVGASHTPSSIFGTVTKPSRIRNESGAVVDSGGSRKKSIYEDWKRKSKLVIQKAGEEENASAKAGSTLSQMRRRQYRHTSDNSQNHIKDELKTPDQIIKARKIKDLKQTLQNKKKRKNIHNPKKTRKVDMKKSQARTRSRLVVHSG
jgi:hypothetical protein